MGSLVAELAEKLSSATNSLDFDEQTLYINTSTNKVAIGTNAPVTDLTIEGPITIKEQADADADTAAYGQIWVNTATPNELYYTTDSGVDIQITDATGLATGGLSIPKIGASKFGYEIAKKFKLDIIETLPALVPLTFSEKILTMCNELSGLSLEAVVSINKIFFE